MGYRGKIIEQNRCRDLRAIGWTYNEIAAEVGVSKSSVSLWCRDVEPDAQVWAARARSNRNHGARNKRPHPQQIAKHEEIARLQAEGKARIGRLTEKEFLVAGVALYAGEGSKTKEASLANCDPRIVLFFVTWLRHFFAPNEDKLRLSLYLHQGLDLDEALAFWCELTHVSPSQLRKPYRAVADPSIRNSKHPMGCLTVICCGVSIHRQVMGLVSALLTCDDAIPG